VTVSSSEINFGSIDPTSTPISPNRILAVDSQKVRHTGYPTRNKSLDCITSIPVVYPKQLVRLQNRPLHVPNHQTNRQSSRSKSLSPNTEGGRTHSRLPVDIRSSLICGLDTSLLEVSRMEDLDQQSRANGINTRGSSTLQCCIPAVCKADASKQTTSQSQIDSKDIVCSLLHQDTALRNIKLKDRQIVPGNRYPSQGMTNQVRPGVPQHYSGRSLVQQNQNPATGRSRRCSCSSRWLSPVDIGHQKTHYGPRGSTGTNALMHQSLDLSQVKASYLSSDSNHRSQKVGNGRPIRPVIHITNNSSRSLSPKDVARRKKMALLHRSLDLSHVDASYLSGNSYHQSQKVVSGGTSRTVVGITGNPNDIAQRKTNASLHRSLDLSHVDASYLSGDSNHRSQKAVIGGSSLRPVVNITSNSSRSLSPKIIVRQKIQHPTRGTTSRNTGYHQSPDLSYVDTSFVLSDDHYYKSQQKSVYHKSIPKRPYDLESKKKFGLTSSKASPPKIAK
jgi:hypothetical protein